MRWSTEVLERWSNGCFRLQNSACLKSKSKIYNLKSAIVCRFLYHVVKMTEDRRE